MSRPWPFKNVILVLALVLRSGICVGIEIGISIGYLCKGSSTM